MFGQLFNHIKLILLRICSNGLPSLGELSMVVSGTCFLINSYTKFYISHKTNRISE